MATFNQQRKLDNLMSKYTKHCPTCGHSIVYTPTCPKDKLLCSHCGYYMFRNEDAKNEYNKQIFMNTLKRHLI